MKLLKRLLIDQFHFPGRFGFGPVLLAIVLSTQSSAGPTTNAACCHSCCQQPLAQTQLSGKSIYQSDSTWTNDAGKELALRSLAGRPQVVAMFFANCQYTCPLIVNDMKRIEAELSPEQRDRVGFTLVSFDAVRDTPAALAEYRHLRNLESSRWTLLHGDPDAVMEMAALLGVRYKQDANGQFMHSNVITILNSQGEVVRQIGLGTDIKATAELVSKLLTDRR
jgi:protein SCO1/2